MSKVKLLIILLVGLFSVISFSKTLTLWTTYTEDKTEYSILKSYTDEFTENTKIKINIVSIPDLTDYDTKLRISAPSGVGPDLLATAPHDGIGKWVEQRILMPLDGEMDDLLYNFEDSAMMAVTYKNKVYGIPFSMESVGLVYNKKYVKEVPKTWDEIIEITKKMQKEGKEGLVFPAAEAYHMYSILRGFGGYIFKWDNGNYDVKDIGMNNDGAIKSIKFIKNLFDEKILNKTLYDSNSMHSYSTGTFEEGNAAFQINGPWVLKGLDDAGIEYGIAKIPNLPGDLPARPFMGVQFIGINNFGRYKEDTIKLVRFLTTKERMLNFALKTKRVPARSDVINSNELMEDQIIKGWAQQAIYGEPMPAIPEMGVVWTAWRDSLPLMYSGAQPIESTLEELVRVIGKKVEMIRK